MGGRRSTPGVPESLWIWQDEGLALAHCGPRRSHTFTGSMASSSRDGKLKNGPTRTEWSDRVRVSGNRASFDVYTDGDADGIDFDVAGNGCVRFYLAIDGKAQPQLIHLGRDGVRPEKAHFKLCN